MKLTRESLSKTKAKQFEDVILFIVQDQRFAIAAKSVDEIRNLDGLTPLPPAMKHSRLAKVNSTLIRRNKVPEKVFFAVNGATHFGMPAVEPARVLVLQDAPVALLVSNIDRMTQISTVVALPLAFSGKEREWYRGLALLGDQVVPLVNPEAFLNKGEQAVLKASWLGLAAAAKGAVPA